MQNHATPSAKTAPDASQERQQATIALSGIYASLSASPCIPGPHSDPWAVSGLDDLEVVL